VDNRRLHDQPAVKITWSRRPNGAVLVAESMFTERPPRSLVDYAMINTMRCADTIGVSANRITLLRNADGDGVAEIRRVFLGSLNRPFGMALIGDTFHVGNVRSPPHAALAVDLPSPGAGARRQNAGAVTLAPLSV
jgi:glucose/arabinose dehydrogenase